jgi:hypothetical protein
MIGGGRRMELERLGSPASIEEVVDLEVGGERKALFRVQPVQP